MSPEVLFRKIEHLRTYLNDLSEFKNCSQDMYLANRYKIDRLLELIIVSIDIVLHLLSKHGETIPGTYAASFLRAGEVDLLPKDLAERLAKAAGLRNTLAHGYEDLDPGIVYKSIDLALSDFPRLIEILEK